MNLAIKRDEKFEKIFRWTEMRTWRYQNRQFDQVGRFFRLGTTIDQPNGTTHRIPQGLPYPARAESSFEPLAAFFRQFMLFIESLHLTAIAFFAGFKQTFSSAALCRRFQPDSDRFRCVITYRQSSPHGGQRRPTTSSSKFSISGLRDAMPVFDLCNNEKLCIHPVYTYVSCLVRLEYERIVKLIVAFIARRDGIELHNNVLLEIIIEMLIYCRTGKDEINFIVAAERCLSVVVKLNLRQNK
ncbi:hypothetical protein TcasGA2_TC011416 [Tribolium castaneum]|uniref:Uncharacterized protein n=1 Tax=Tribolium castaneum TaxID=7070 RepID=D6X4I7_TRICA|nr:hypothetical protein TcasGA2_TC011416 [Tribolium castaneum]